MCVSPQSGNQVSTSLGNSGLCRTVFARNRDTAVPAEGNGDLQTLICVLVARPRRCLTLSNPVPWQNWMTAYLGYTLRMKTLFRGWPVMAHDTHTKRRRSMTSTHAGPWKRLAGTPAVPSPLVGQNHSSDKKTDSCKNKKNKLCRQYVNVCTGILGFHIPLHTLWLILVLILWVIWPNQQCHHTMVSQPGQGPIPPD